MKKTYMQPQMAVVKIAPATLIAESWTKSSDTLTAEEILTKDEGDWDELWDE